MAKVVEALAQCPCVVVRRQKAGFSQGVARMTDRINVEGGVCSGVRGTRLFTCCSFKVI